jgi:hypothetical protein
MTLIYFQYIYTTLDTPNYLLVPCTFENILDTMQSSNDNDVKKPEMIDLKPTAQFLGDLN